MTREPGKVPTVERGSREHYADAALYDYEYRRRRDDVSFYRRFASELFTGPGEILEVCCGSGRVTAALCRDRHQVTGFDASPEMVARARERLANIGRATRACARLEVRDMRSFRFRARFRLAVMAFNSLEHLYERPDIEACLRRIRDHLDRGGRLVFDVQMPNLRWLTRDPEKRWARTRFRHPRTGQRLEYSTNHTYDAVRQVAHIRIFYRPLEPGPLRRTQIVHLDQRKFFPAELETLVNGAGFDLEAQFGDFDGDPLSEMAESQVLVCRRRD